MILSTITRYGTRPLLGAAVLRTALLLFLAAVIGTLAAACAGGPAGPPTASLIPKMQVVTTTAILADFVENVGGDRVEVRSVVPFGADVHSFQSTPADSIAVSKARVIVSNGLGLDSFLDRLFKSSKRSDSVHVVVTEGLSDGPATGIELAQDGGDRSLGDPHIWQNPLYAAYCVERIRDALVRVDPVNAQEYRANASAYVRKLSELDREIAMTLDAIPPERRHLVTFHDAFGYFARRYGWKVSPFVLGDPTSVTPRTVVEVMHRVKEEGIPVVFAEPQFNSDVLNQAAGDAGVAIGRIYSGTLDAKVTTYIDMMRFNANSLLRLQR